MGNMQGGGPGILGFDWLNKQIKSPIDSQNQSAVDSANASKAQYLASIKAKQDKDQLDAIGQVTADQTESLIQQNKAKSKNSGLGSTILTSGGGSLQSMSTGYRIPTLLGL